MDMPRFGFLARPQKLNLVFVFLLSGVLLLQGAGAAQAADGSRVTDDPQGRVRIPLAESSPPVRNDHDIEMYGVFDPEEDQKAVTREAQAQTDAIGSPLVIPAAAFAPDGLHPDSQFFPFGGGYFAGDSANYGCMVAPAYLPAGAVLTDMFASVYDDDAAINIMVTLRRLDNFAGGTDTMASAASTGQFAGVQTIADSTIDFPTVVYPDYSYYVTLCVQSGSVRIYSVRLYY